jgi:hypothetical protein
MPVIRAMRGGRWMARVVALGAGLLPGCGATLLGRLDLLLGSGASDNALLLAYSSVLPLAELLLRVR